MPHIHIRPYVKEDLPAMREIWNQVVEEGNAFPQTEPLSPADAEPFFASQSFCAYRRNVGAPFPAKRAGTGLSCAAVQCSRGF